MPPYNEEPSAPHKDYIGARIFDPDTTATTINRISASPRIESLIAQLAQKKFKDDSSKPLEYYTRDLHNQTKDILNKMIASISSTNVTRCFGWTVKAILGRIYHHGVHVRESEIALLKETAKKAEADGVSMIFLPCHKSHIDYLVVSHILYSIGIALPHIAAGDNLNLPLIGALLRYNGAFFIRRQWGDDKLYIAVMKEYLESLMEKGYNMEAFIEGTRSRTGKLLQPKFGIIKTILEAVFSGRVKDAILVPMSIGYDKVIETPTYVNELLGKPKEKESLAQLVNSGFSLLSLKGGRIDVRFGTPFSLKSFIDEAL